MVWPMDCCGAAGAQVVAACLTGERGKAFVNIFEDDDNIQTELANAHRNMLQFTLIFACGDSEADQKFTPKHGRVFHLNNPTAANDTEEDPSEKRAYRKCYTTGVKSVLGWLVRNGCRLERLDNHWETGVGDSGSEHTAAQPLHWNALHALLHVPNATAGLPPDAPQVSLEPASALALEYCMDRSVST